MTLHLRPETHARLAANAAALGISINEYLEALVERELQPKATAAEALSIGGQFQREHGLWVYRTGEPMPPSLVEDTLDAARREREEIHSGNSPR
jgi:hypothetical protein